MNTILVDDEPWAMLSFAKECALNSNFDVVGTFQNPLDALSFSKDTRVDFAILDIDMPNMNGVELSLELRKQQPDMIIIFVTAHEEYVLPALKAKSDYFITKPYSLSDVSDALFRAKLLSQRLRKPVYIRAFGNFDVFLNNVPVKFSSAKSKELLALLVNAKGGIVTTEEAMATIWEEREFSKDNTALCRTAAMRLRKTLSDNGIEYIMSENSMGRYINRDSFDCDYYYYLNGIREAKQAFTGEYMSQNSWAESTLASLLSKIDLLQRD